MTENSFTPVSVRRRSAAQGCAHAQSTPCEHGGDTSSRRSHHASSFERLSGRRASRMYGHEAAGTHAAAAGEAAPAGASRRARRAATSARSHPAVPAQMIADHRGYFWCFGGFATNIFFACGALKGASPGGPCLSAQNRLPWASPSYPSPPTPRENPGHCEHSARSGTHTFQHITPC